MVRAQFCTDRRLWAVFAACAFIALGFIDPVAGTAKGDNSLWGWVGVLLRGAYSCSTGDMIAPIVFRTVLQAVPALLIGWVAQALLVVIVSRFGTAAPPVLSSRIVAGDRLTNCDSRGPLPGAGQSVDSA